MRSVGTLLSLICLVQQMVATCPSSQAEEACFHGFDHMLPEVSRDSDHSHSSCCSKRVDATLPARSDIHQDEPTHSEHQLVHLCSGSHASYPLPPARVAFDAAVSIDWLSIPDWVSLDVNTTVFSSVPLFSPDAFTISRASLRARLQVFLI